MRRIRGDARRCLTSFLSGLFHVLRLHASDSAASFVGRAEVGAWHYHSTAAGWLMLLWHHALRRLRSALPSGVAARSAFGVLQAGGTWSECQPVASSRRPSPKGQTANGRAHVCFCRATVAATAHPSTGRWELALKHNTHPTIQATRQLLVRSRHKHGRCSTRSGSLASAESCPGRWPVFAPFCNKFCHCVQLQP
jgi:hypothetical protein